MTDDQPALATAVRHHADRLPPTPAPWPAIRRRHRLGTLRRGVLAATAAVAVAGLAVAVGPASLTTTQDTLRPAAPWPSDPRLGTGSAWARAFDAEFVEQLGSSSGTSRELLYADDVDGFRVALVHTVDTRGEPTHLYWWAYGPAGASPDRMAVERSAVDPDTAYAVSLPVTAPGDREATVLVAGPAGAELSVYSYDEVDPDGEAYSPWTTGTEIAAGVYRARIGVPVNGLQLRLAGNGVSWHRPITGTVQVPPAKDAAWWAAASPGARGDAGAGLPDKLLIQTVYNQLSLPSDVPGSRVLWTLRDGVRRHSAVALRTAAGGWAVAGIATEPRVTDPSSGGYTEGSSTRAAVPRPDGDPAALVLAWYVDTGANADNAFVPTSDRLAVVGPPAATQVRLDGAATPVPLPGGAGLVHRGGVRTVEFLDATGRSLGTTDVAKPWSFTSHLHAP
jgi:hypothetical protein